MYGNRGETVQPNGYLENSKPRQVEMRNYTSPKQDPVQPAPQQRYYETQPDNQPQAAKDSNQPTWAGYILHWVAFLVAVGINIGIWAIDYNAVSRQASIYYYNTFTVSSYVDTTTYANSNSMFPTSNPFDTLGTAMSLVYSWVLWKGPILIYVLHLIEHQESKIIKIVTFAAEVAILLAIDILLTIYASSFWNEWIYYGAFVLLSLTVTLVNNCGINRTKEAILNTLIPLLLIAALYVIYTLLLPTLYHLYLNSLEAMSAVFLLIYLYPAFDLLLYALTLYLGTKVQDKVKGLLSVIHYFLLGYGVGMVLIVGYTEVEFYYLLGYFIFRNVFVNHVMRNWQKVVANPPALPGWIILYYISYALSFLPVVGVGKIVVAKSFMSYIFALTKTVLYGSYNPLYFSTTPPSSALPNLNTSLGGNIYWLAAAIIWAAITFSQRYDRKMPQGYDLFYYIVGVHLFYIGIASSLSVYPLSTSGNL